MLFKKYFVSIPLLLICVLLSHSGWSQKYRKNYFQGYIITNHDDTIRGQIKLKGNFDKKVHIQQDTSNHVKTIPSALLKEIHLNLMVLGKVKIRGKSHMYERLATGHYDLFGFQKATADFVRNYYYVRESGKEPIEITPGNFKELMDKYIEDYPELRQRILLGEYKYGDLQYIFRRYNLWKATGE